MDNRVGQPSYQATAGANKIITARAAILHRIIIGKSVSNAIIEISDSKTDGDGDVKVYLAGDTLVGVHDIGVVFKTGIAVDQAEQTNVTYVWSNHGHA